MKLNGFGSTALLVALTAGLSAQQTTGKPATAATPAAPQEKPTFKVQVDLVTTDVIARDDKGNFVADLTKDEFEVYEDGVKQDIVSMTLSHGGRVTQRARAAAAGRARRHHPAAARAARTTSRAASSCSSSTTCTCSSRTRAARARALQEDLEDAAPRRRHVRHRVERHLVDFHRA